MSYSYLRTAKAIPTLRDLLTDHLEVVAKAVAAVIPRRLTADEVKVRSGVGPNYAEVSFKGYTRSDLACEGAVGMTAMDAPVEIVLHCSAKSPDMTRPAQVEFRIGWNDDALAVAQRIGTWFEQF